VKRRGFTLIELLVVIAILSLLVSILVPSLAAAKELARQAVCMSNIRQLLLANKGYSVENDGYFVPAAEDIFSSNRKRWHGRREATNEPFDARRGPLRKYLADGQVKGCPSFTEYLDRAGSSGAFEAGCGGYGYNSSYVGGRADLYGMGPTAATKTAKDSDIRHPGRTIMFTDAAYMQGGGGSREYIAYSFCEPVFWQLAPGPPSSQRPNPTIHFRHAGACDVAWADGHVDRRRMSFTVDYITHSRISAAQAAQSGLGWFGPESNELFDLE